MERMGFYLVDGRPDLIVDDQIDEPVGVKITDTDGPDSPCLVKLLHGPPFTVYVAVRLVNEV